tara:strand:+ start:41 stop:625 length:585 start_codon:yes stop_codon:yes gene_type:complete
VGMIVTVTINNVLRDIFSKFEEVYNKYHEVGVTSKVETPDLLGYTHFEDADALYEFIYSESPMEIFGQAKELELNIISHLTKLYKEMPKDFRLRIVGDDIGRAKSSTLWFLAKYACSCDEIAFYNSLTVDDVWDKTDIVITADLDLIESKPKNKELIIVDRVYNKDLLSNLRIKSIKQIKSFDKIYEGFDGFTV